jgi:hypothetical protein
MRWSIAVTSLSAPSAVCAIEMPSLALRTPCCMPWICAVMVVVMARPAASSLALLMRLPVDRRCIATPVCCDAVIEALAARSAAILVLMTAIFPFSTMG